MKKNMTHWTERSVDDFLYRIAADFVMQLEKRIESEPLSKTKLAQKLGVTKGRVSQILNNPGNLTLRMIIKCARALGMKVAVVAYDDNDRENELGPVNSEIFRVCWENSGKPVDFWSIEKPRCSAISIALFEVPPTGITYVPQQHFSYTWQGDLVHSLWSLASHENVRITGENVATTATSSIIRKKPLIENEVIGNV